MSLSTKIWSDMKLHVLLLTCFIVYLDLVLAAVSSSVILAVKLLCIVWDIRLVWSIQFPLSACRLFQLSHCTPGLYDNELLSISLCRLKPRLHQQQCRSNRQQCWSSVRLCLVNIRLCCPKRQQCERVYRKILFFRESRMLLRHCCRFLATMLPLLVTASTEFFMKFPFLAKSKQIEHVWFVSTLLKAWNFVVLRCGSYLPCCRC